MHNHTVSSNGPVVSPREVRRVYEEAGYQFAAITDHDRRADQVPWTDDDYEVDEPGVFALLRGHEASFPNDHVNCIGCQPEDLTKAPGQAGFVDEAREAGALVFMNHPARYNKRPKLVVDDPEFRLLHGLEVYSGARVERSGSRGPLAVRLWDACLACGLRLWAFASADCHNYDFKLPDSPTNGYVVAFADAIERTSIMDALHSGRFYASSGVDVKSVRLANGKLEVASTNADTITFIGRGGTLSKRNGPSASYRIRGDEDYVRAECQRDEPCFAAAGAPPQTAWLQPLWLQ